MDIDIFVYLLFIGLLLLYGVCLIKFHNRRDYWWEAYWIDYDIRWDKYWKHEGLSFPHGFETDIKNKAVDKYFSKNKLFVVLLNKVVYNVGTSKSQAKTIVKILNNEFNYNGFSYEKWSGAELRKYVENIRGD